MEVFIYGWWRSHQSLAHKRSTYCQVLYYAEERWTRTHNQTMHAKTDWRGSKVHQSTELWTESMVSQWISRVISSQDSPHCSSAAKCKGCCQDWAYHLKKSLDGLSSCRCSTKTHGDLKTIKRTWIKCSTRFSLCEEIWSRTMVIPRTWIRNEVVLYQWR